MPSALAKLQKDFSEHLIEENQQFTGVHGKLDSITKSHAEVRLEMEAIRKDVDSITNVKVNGFVGVVPLLQALHTQGREMVELTSDLRKDRDFKKAREAWYQSHKIPKFLMKNRYGNIVFAVIILYVMLAVLYAMGLPTNPNVIAWALIKGKFNI